CGVACMIFFFSSRRRHTRCYRDWSSDVCSSDLERDAARTADSPRTPALRDAARSPQVWAVRTAAMRNLATPGPPGASLGAQTLKIGRASCRERVETRERREDSQRE